MVSFENINVVVLFGFFVGLALYDRNIEGNTDIGEYERNKKTLYGIILTIYSTYVYTLFFKSKKTNLTMILIFLGFIAIIALVLKMADKSESYAFFNRIKDTVFSPVATYSVEQMRSIHEPQTFTVSALHRQVAIDFIIYLDVVNKMTDKVKLLTVNDCAIIEYNNANHSLDFVQYDCASTTKYSVPVKYVKWIKFRVECIKEHDESSPMLIGIEIDDVLVYSNKVYDNVSNIESVTIGDDIDHSIGFMKNLAINSS